MNMNLPENVQKIFQILEMGNKEAFLVGGCVRDAALNKPPHDYDFTTNAEPEFVAKLFAAAGYQIIPTGIKHGTVTIMIDKEPYEVTTYRIDGQYSDGRRPDSVTYTSSLLEDLKRRDFTMNAMAYNPSIGLIDPFHGMDDLNNHIICCVGDPMDRFKEDPLRILRAWRFACTNGLTIDAETKVAMEKLHEDLKLVSRERVQMELIKALSSSPNIFAAKVLESDVLKWFIPGWDEMDMEQNNKNHLFNVKEHTMIAFASLPDNSDAVTRLAVLFHDIGKPETKTTDEQGIDHFLGHAQKSAELADAILKELKFDNKTREAVVELVDRHDIAIEADEKSVKRWLNRLGPEQFERLLMVQQADAKGQNWEYSKERYERLEDVRKIAAEVLEKESCLGLKDLAVNGRDMMELGYKGKEIGEQLNTLLNAVLNNEVANDKDALLAFLNEEKEPEAEICE